MQKIIFTILLCSVLTIVLTSCGKTKKEFAVDGKSDVDNSIITETNEIKWNEITNNGVDEEKLLQNVDEEILKEVAKSLQELITEETEEEKENPNILITEGWTRIFKKDKYKKIVNIGNSAVKPLFYILYKSNDNGLYEYACAIALEDITGIGNELNKDGTKKWTTAKEYLEIFIKEIKNQK